MSPRPQLRWHKRDDTEVVSDSVMNDDFSSHGKHRREQFAEEAAAHGARVAAENELFDGTNFEEYSQLRRMMERGHTHEEILAEKQKLRSGAREKALRDAATGDEYIRLRETGGR